MGVGQLVQDKERDSWLTSAETFGMVEMGRKMAETCEERGSDVAKKENFFDTY